jgi:Flp pilus assembly protein TadD
MRRLASGVLWVLGLYGQTSSLIDQAQAAFRAGDLDRAAGIAQRAITQNPGSANAHLILGIIAGQRQQWDAAAVHLQTVVRLSPTNPHGYFYLGQAQLYQRKWSAAAQYLGKALQLNYPDKDRLLVELAFAENETGRPQLALDHLKQIRDPGAYAAQYHAVTAFAQSRLQHYPAAIAAIRSACELEPHDSQYWEFLISTLISTDQTQVALSEAIRAQAIFPDDAEIQYLFALTSYYVSESPLSGLALRNLQEAAPGSPKALLAAGLLHRKEGRLEEATQAFLRAAKLGVPDSHALLGIIYREQGNAVAAEQEFRQAAQANPNNAQVLLELGKIALARGQVNAALTRLGRAVTLMPENSPAHYQLGLAYSRSGQKDKANEQFDLSRELDRQQAELQGSGRRQ